MLVLWFGSEQECREGLEVINANFRAGATLQGYDLDGEGNIIGKDSTGMDRPDAQVTTSWDAPHYDYLTAGWWILDPAARFPQDAADRLLNGVVGAEHGEYEYPPEDEGA